MAAVLLVSLRPAAAEIGWREADYVKQFGKPVRSPLVANEAQFTAKGGGVLVIFANGRSREEAWLIVRDDRFVPKPLLAQARQVLNSPLKNRVDFRAERVPPAEIFEGQFNGLTVQVDRRRGAIVRIGRCRAPETCTLLDRLLVMERTTDDLMARTQARMKEESHRH